MLLLRVLYIIGIDARGLCCCSIAAAPFKRNHNNIPFHIILSSIVIITWFCFLSEIMRFVLSDRVIRE